MTNQFESVEGFAEKAKPIAPLEAIASSVKPDIVAKMMSELSEDQRAAAEATAHNILLLAPAGTGKTRTMTTRFLNILSNGVKPERVLMCTYTNAAANELIERIEPALTVKTEDLWVGTTHSIGLRIIREHASLIGLVNVDTIINREEQEEIIKRLMVTNRHPMVNTANEKATIRKILEFIEKAKTVMKSPDEAMIALAEGDVQWAAGVATEDANIYGDYEKYKMAYDMIDYNDMLYMPTRILEQNTNIAEQWQSMFDHAMVDEYQDLSRSQIRLLKNIIGNKPDGASLYAAADDDQSIYGWRGSDVKATIEFQRYWTNAIIIHITDNYRTPRAIFSHAANLIRHNSNRYPKNINTRVDPDAMVRIVNKIDGAAEKQAVMEAIIEGMKRYNIPHEKVGILCRSNRSCQEYATYLASNKMPVNLHESIQLNAESINALISWMRLNTAADHPLMYEKIASYPEQYLPENALIDHSARLQKRNNRNSDQDKIGPVGLLMEMHEKGKTTTGSKLLAEKIIEVRDFLGKNQANPFASLAEFLGITKMAAASQRQEDHQLPAFLRLADEMAGQIGVTKTLASLTQLDLNAGRKGVNVSTMHGAKGLEYDIVALPEWEDGEFPKNMSKSENELSEERRLAYVALTRPKKMLIVSWSGRGNRQSRPSRFLMESGLIDEEQLG